MSEDHHHHHEEDDDNNKKEKERRMNETTPKIHSKKKKSQRPKGGWLYIVFVGVILGSGLSQLHVGSYYLFILQEAEETATSSSSHHHPAPENRAKKDANCIFRDSPLYRSVYVYPSPGEPEWWAELERSHTSSNATTTTTTRILSKEGRAFASDFRYPWQKIEERTRQSQSFQFRLKDARAIQYTTELIVRDILTHFDSCLRTRDPTQASLVYIPYLISMEWHNGSQYPKSFETSPYAQAILDILQRQNYDAWERVWGLSADLWKRRNGSDHILVFSEGCHGLIHPHGMAGNDVMLYAQEQFKAPIIIYKDTSRTFLQMYPQCAAKNIVVPAPNPDGRWFNGKVDRMAQLLAQNASFRTSPHRLPNDPQERPLSYYYKAGNHGSCRRLRQQLEFDFEQCSGIGNYIREKIAKRHLPKGYHFPHAFRHATFCPTPGGDTPNSKRYFDALMAGCIPLILSQDFVWPNSAEIPGSRVRIVEQDISIRLNTSDFFPGPEGSTQLTCGGTQVPRQRVQNYIETIPKSEIARLQSNLQRLASTYAYYERSTSLPDHPLLHRVLPNGPAAHALVQELADRRFGNRWPACQEEIATKRPYETDNVHVFQC